MRTSSRPGRRTGYLKRLAVAAASVALVACGAEIVPLPSGAEQPEPGLDLFARTKQCERDIGGEYLVRVSYPESWWADEDCVWFAPEPLDVREPLERPDGVAITIGTAGGPPMPADGFTRTMPIDGYRAIRVAEHLPDVERVTFWVPLGPNGGGPTVVGLTTTEWGGDYELNVRVLDRLMEGLMVEERR